MDLSTLRKSRETLLPRAQHWRGLETAAKSLGFGTEGVQTGREALPTLQLPAIAWWQGNHYVALLSAQGKGDEGTVTIRDPNKDREETMSAESFLRKSAGYLLLIHKK